MRVEAPFSHPNGTKLFGPAGAGKTRQLVTWLREHEDGGDFRVRDGIICSFTRAAAHDIARRVRGDDGEPAPYHATLHALARRYHGIDQQLAEPRLGEFFAEHHIAYDRGTGADTDQWIEAGGSPGNLINAFWVRCRNLLISLDEGLRRETPAPKLVPYWDAGTMNRLFGRYLEWKRQNSLVDFTDMLEDAAASPPSGTQWPVFVVDEAQDQTPLQWRVAQGFAAASEVCYVAGDDDQCLYSWSGAQPESFLDADLGGADILHVNHRSGSNIVDYAQAFIRRNRVRVDKGMMASREGGVVAHCDELPVLHPAQSTYLMARAHYLMSDWITDLEERGYPFLDRRKSGGVNGRAALAYRRFLALRDGRRLTLAEWRLLATDAIASDGPWLTRGAKTRLRALDAQLAERTLVGVDDLTAYGGTADLQDAIRAGAVAPLSRLPQKRIGYLRRVAERWGEEYLDEHRAASVCQVGPIHQFKGLECDHAVVHSGLPPAAVNDALVNPEAERRVIYVAMTRARERLSIVNAHAAVQWQTVL